MAIHPNNSTGSATKKAAITATNTMINVTLKYPNILFVKYNKNQKHRFKAKNKMAYAIEYDAVLELVFMFIDLIFKRLGRVVFGTRC